ncbi:MAG: hypothetical protein AAB343_00600 [Patescibacteria group bacterium]
MELTVLAGTDARQIFQHVRRIIEEATQKQEIISEVDVDEAGEEVLEILAARSLFIGKRCVIVKNLFKNEAVADAVYAWWKTEKQRNDQLVIVVVNGEKTTAHPMLAYAKKQKYITTYDLKSAGEEVGRREIYQFVDEYLTGNTTRVLSEYASLTRRGVKAPELFWALHFQVRSMVSVLEYARKGISEVEIIERTKLHPYVVGKCVRMSRTLPPGFLTRTLSRLRDIDLKIKTTPSQFDDVFLQFLLTA